MTNSAYWLDELVGILLRCTDLLQWPEIQVSFKILVIIIFRCFNYMYNFCLHKCGILIQCDCLVSLCADWTYLFLAAFFRDETRAPCKRLISAALSNDYCMIVVMQVSGSMSFIMSSLFVTSSIWVASYLRSRVDKFAHKATSWKSCWKTFAMPHCSHPICIIRFLWMLSQSSYNHEHRRGFKIHSLESSLMFSSSP